MRTGAAPGHSYSNKRGRSARAVSGVALGVVALSGFVLAACGSSPSAAQQVCSDRTQLKGAVSTVVNDVRSGSFSQAKDDLSAVSDAFDNLTKSVEQLASDQSQALSPQIDNLKSTVLGLKDSKSLSDLVSGLDSASTQAQSISKEIADALHCS